jgi:hypothetical protein
MPILIYISDLVRFDRFFRRLFSKQTPNFMRLVGVGVSVGRGDVLDGSTVQSLEFSPPFRATTGAG